MVVPFAPPATISTGALRQCSPEALIRRGIPPKVVAEAGYNLFKFLLVA
jgi:hypothetical protein